MKQVLLIASGVLATVPGLASLTGHLPTPPGQKILFSAVAEVLGVSTILIFWIGRRWIAQLTGGTATRIGVALGVFFLVCFGLNTWLQTVTVVSEQGRSPVFLPLWPGNELAHMIDNAGSRHRALIAYGADSLIDASQETPFSLAVTMFIVLAVHQIMLLTPVVLCCGLGLRAKNDSTQPISSNNRMETDEE